MTSPVLLSDSQARAFLATSPWLRKFPEDLRESLLASARLLPPFDRGQRVYNIGDVPNGMYGIVSGCFGFEVAPQEEGPQLIHQLRAGVWFGELAHVLERPRLATMYATRPSQCMHVPARALNKLMHEDPRLWKHFALAMANATVFAFTAINDLIGRSPKRRVAAALLRVAGYRDDIALEEEVVELDLTHGNLALLSNCSRSTVAQYLQELELDGYLECQYGKTFLTQPLALREWLKCEPE
ncbi:MAG: Crp/Fnr family transcriptional regulator [Wenzhouxiangella sp.]|jgi:CRP-like cAMP-binding protein|nr:Crp/Fnr family transcriptional regulator [Wenzhouxiangella sp.]